MTTGEANPTVGAITEQVDIGVVAAAACDIDLQGKGRARGKRLVGEGIVSPVISWL